MRYGPTRPTGPDFGPFSEGAGEFYLGERVDKCCDICYRIFNMQGLSGRLRYCRVSKEWTQEQLARNLGVSLNTVQRWEAGKTRPSPLAREKLEQVLRDVLERDQLRLF